MVLNISDLKALKINQTVTGEVIYKRRKCYVGVRLKGVWDDEEERNEESSQSKKSDVRVQGWKITPVALRKALKLPIQSKLKLLRCPRPAYQRRRGDACPFKRLKNI